MKIIILLLALCFAIPCYADVVLYRYTDKVTGEERGLCWGNEGAPPVDNPDWKSEIIEEKLQKHYLNEHKKQLNAKEKIAKDKKKVIVDKLKIKLKDLGLTDDEIAVVLP